LSEYEAKKKEEEQQVTTMTAIDSDFISKYKKSDRKTR
jgi:hypothetical protein